MTDMKGRITFTIIKPGAVQNEYVGPILNMIHNAGFHIAALKLTRLTQPQAERFYAVHKGKPFYEGLVNFMLSGPIVVAILEKDNAVEDYRKLIGSTDPAKAEPGTIRKLFAESVQKNAVHGSDSDETAVKECDFFFSTSARFYKKEECV
jgi:nucleoside-diphosphate kinase